VWGELDELVSSSESIHGVITRGHGRIKNKEEIEKEAEKGTNCNAIQCNPLQLC
jgi:hypothetical protein